MTSQAPDFPRIAYSLSEAEVLSGLSRATLYRLIAQGRLHTVHVGRRRLVPSDDLVALVAAKSETAHAA